MNFIKIIKEKLIFIFSGRTKEEKYKIPDYPISYRECRKKIVEDCVRELNKLTELFKVHEAEIVGWDVIFIANALFSIRKLVDMIEDLY